MKRLIFVALCLLKAGAYADPVGPIDIKKGTEPAWLLVTATADPNRPTYAVRVNKDKGIDVDKHRFALTFKVPKYGNHAFLIPVELRQDTTGLGAVLIVPEEIARKGILYLDVASREVKNGQSYVISMSSYLTIGDVESDAKKALGKAYFQTYRSIEAAERFIREHPKERALCAGALLNIAAVQERQDKKKAIESYQKAVDEYADEIVPDKNANFTVENWASFRIARLERDTGNREKALQLFGKLMTSSDFNTRSSSRIEYLATKQSNLKVAAEVAVQGKGPFSLSSRIPVVVSVKNPTKETITFKCYARIEHREDQSYHALAPREGCEEITIEPKESRVVPMMFTEKDTKGIEPGVYQLKASLTGVPFDSTTETIEIKK